jgi:hypothetical protein
VLYEESEIREAWADYFEKLGHFFSLYKDLKIFLLFFSSMYVVQCGFLLLPAFFQCQNFSLGNGSPSRQSDGYEYTK